VFVIAAVVVLTVAVAGWFLLRGHGPSSEFIVAHDRFVGAAHDVEAAEGKVRRFLDLSTFQATVDNRIAVMRKEAAIFLRLSRDEGDNAASIAKEAAQTSSRALTAIYAYQDAIQRTHNLSAANSSITQLEAQLAELDRLAQEWKDLSK